jgi:hypothetical protein
VFATNERGKQRCEGMASIIPPCLCAAAEDALQCNTSRTQRVARPPHHITTPPPQTLPKPKIASSQATETACRIVLGRGERPNAHTSTHHIHTHYIHTYEHWTLEQPPALCLFVVPSALLVLCSRETPLFPRTRLCVAGGVISGVMANHRSRPPVLPCSFRTCS